MCIMSMTTVAVTAHVRIWRRELWAWPVKFHCGLVVITPRNGKTITGSRQSYSKRCPCHVDGLYMGTMQKKNNQNKVVESPPHFMKLTFCLQC